MGKDKKSKNRIMHIQFMLKGPVVELASDFDDSENEILADFWASHQREANALAAERNYESRL
jgi:hypothetical protein